MNNINAIRSIIKAQRAKYRRQRLKQNYELINDDATAIFEKTDGDLAIEEQNVVDLVMVSSYNRFSSRFQGFTEVFSEKMIQHS